MSSSASFSPAPTTSICVPILISERSALQVLEQRFGCARGLGIGRQSHGPFQMPAGSIVLLTGHRSAGLLERFLRLLLPLGLNLRFAAFHLAARVVIAALAAKGATRRVARSRGRPAPLCV